MQSKCSHLLSQKKGEDKKEVKKGEDEGVGEGAWVSSMSLYSGEGEEVSEALVKNKKIWAQLMHFALIGFTDYLKFNDMQCFSSAFN